MPKEIERKFIVDKEKLPLLTDGLGISQGYILNSPEKVVRVRATQHEGKHQWGFITVKGKTEGMSRDEYEYDIPFSEALEMLNNLCESTLEKTRYLYDYEGHTWEIDFFTGTDVIVAEVEIHSEDEDVSIPVTTATFDWLQEYRPDHLNRAYFVNMDAYAIDFMDKNFSREPEMKHVWHPALKEEWAKRMAYPSRREITVD